MITRNSQLPNMPEATFLSLVKLITRGQTIKALQTYYHPDVVVKEPDGTCRIGLEVNITNEEKNLQNVTFVQAKLLGYAIKPSTGVVFSEWQYVFTTTMGESLQLQEVSIQEWEGNLIKSERFYYKDFISV